MSDDNIDYTMQIILSIIGGCIFITSEILPFIKNIKANGLLELLINTGQQFLNKNKLPENETEPLLNSNSNSELNINIPYSDELKTILNTLNNNITNMSCNLNTYINDFQNSRQLKLQSIDLYELNYIINYIKVNYPKKSFQTRFLSKINKQLLISQGYIVDYDSQNDTHIIKW